MRSVLGIHLLVLATVAIVACVPLSDRCSCRYASFQLSPPCPSISDHEDEPQGSQQDMRQMIREEITAAINAMHPPASASSSPAPSLSGM